MSVAGLHQYLPVNYTIPFFGHELTSTQMAAVQTSALGALERSQGAPVILGALGLPLQAFRTREKLYFVLTPGIVSNQNIVGRGAFGVVYRVEKCRIRLADGAMRSGSVAIKYSRFDEDSRAQAVNECRILKCLSNKKGIQAVPKMMCTSSRNGIAIVGKFYSELSLDHYLLKYLEKNIGPDVPGISRLVGHFKVLCEAVRWIHAQGVKHGDISFKNILMDISEQKVNLVLSDFGRAKKYVEVKAQWDASIAAGDTAEVAIRKLLGLFRDDSLPYGDFRLMHDCYTTNDFERYWQVVKAADIFMLGCAFFHVMKVKEASREAYVGKRFESLEEVGVSYQEVSLVDTSGVEQMDEGADEESAYLPNLLAGTPEVVQAYLEGKRWRQTISQISPFDVGMMMHPDPLLRLRTFESRFT